MTVTDSAPWQNGGSATVQDRRDVRVPPHNLVAEESLLGAMLLSRDAIADVLETVTAEQFYRPAHARVFEAVHSLYSAGNPADAVTVAEVLERNDTLEAIGGLDGLLSLQMNTPATSNAASYARIVQENYTLRRLIEVAGEIAELGYGRPDDVTKAVDWAENLMYQVAQGQVGDNTVQLSELLDTTLDRLEELYERGGTITGTATGYKDLDKLLSGLQPSSLYVVGGRPSMGKTSFALGMAAHAAIRGSAAGAGLLAGDGSHGADPAPALFRSPGRLHQDAGRASRRRRLESGSTRPSEGWPKRRSGSTTTRTSRSWRSGPAPVASRARSATCPWSSWTTCS